MCYFFEPWAVINFEPQQRLQKTDNPSRDWQVRLKVVNVWNRDNQKALMEGEVDGFNMILLDLHKYIRKYLVPHA